MEVVCGCLCQTNNKFIKSGCVMPPIMLSFFIINFCLWYTISDGYTLSNMAQVPRASASAVAFGMGLFSGRGSLGEGRHRAFAVTSESRASDTMLRFYDCCQSYKVFCFEVVYISSTVLVMLTSTTFFGFTSS